MPPFSSRYWSALANKGLPVLDQSSRECVEATQLMVKRLANGNDSLWSLDALAHQCSRHHRDEQVVLEQLAYDRMSQREGHYAMLIAFMAQHHR